MYNLAMVSVAVGFSMMREVLLSFGKKVHVRFARNLSVMLSHVNRKNQSEENFKDEQSRARSQTVSLARQSAPDREGLELSCLHRKAPLCLEPSRSYF